MNMKEEATKMFENLENMWEDGWESEEIIESIESGLEEVLIQYGKENLVIEFKHTAEQERNFFEEDGLKIDPKVVRDHCFQLCEDCGDELFNGVMEELNKEGI